MKKIKDLKKMHIYVVVRHFFIMIVMRTGMKPMKKPPKKPLPGEPAP